MPHAAGTQRCGNIQSSTGRGWHRFPEGVSLLWAGEGGLQSGGELWPVGPSWLGGGCLGACLLQGLEHCGRCLRGRRDALAVGQFSGQQFPAPWSEVVQEVTEPHASITLKALVMTCPEYEARTEGGKASSSLPTARQDHQWPEVPLAGLRAGRHLVSCYASWWVKGTF